MKLLYRILRVLFLSYLGVCLVLWLLENSLLYRPVSAKDDWLAPPVTDMEDVNLQTADGMRIHAWWLPCAGSDQALLYCHGNAGNVSHRGGSMAKIRELLKVSVLIFDYPGYGKSEGRPTEQGCYQAADAAYAFLTEGKKFEAKKILIFGGSLGGGVAVDLAARKPHRGLILVKTFTSAPDVGAGMFPWIPVRFLMRNRFDNQSKIAACKQPVFVSHGTADTLIPFAHGKRLYESANDPKHFFSMVDADHNDALPLEFFTELCAFLDRHP